MDIGKSLAYAFEDDRWLNKLGIGALVSLVPILNFAWVGYYIDIMRNVLDGQTAPLPEWHDLGKNFKDGLLVTIAAFLYTLPGLLFLILPIGIMVIPALIQDSDIQGGIAAVTTLTGLVLICCVGLYFLLFSFVFPAVQLRFAQIGTFRSCFDFREVIKMISTQIGDYLVCWLTTLAAGLVIGVVLMMVSLFVGWIPCLGQIIVWVFSLIAGVWASTVYAHIFGQFGLRLSAEPVELIQPQEISG